MDPPENRRKHRNKVNLIYENVHYGGKDTVRLDRTPLETRAV